MLKGKALRRALKTEDVIRVNSDIPLITDKTELITPQIAQEMLKHNENNRPINWKKVEEYAEAMKKGEWRFHSQGIILDQQGNILTGQKRLWAIVYSDTPVYMRVSRGCPANTVRLIDRGTPQTSKDLASRETKRKHSPTETSIARAILILQGKNKPTPDMIADVMIDKANELECLMKETKGTKKTRSVLMILGAICFLSKNGPEELAVLAREVELLSTRLNHKLHPSNAEKCWSRGVAFTLAMESAKQVVEKAITK